MAFDYGKFERRAALADLVRLGCSREVMMHAACRYGIASMQPGEKREALRQSRITHKQIAAQIDSASSLRGFLQRLQQEPRIVAANQIPQESILLWRKDLEHVEMFLKSLVPFRPDAKDAALALSLYIEQQTGQKRLPQLCNLLNAARAAAGLSPLSPEAVRRQTSRANRATAERMLRDWESLAPAKKQKK